MHPEWILALLTFMPHPDDVGRFPQAYEASCQADYCREHLVKVRYLRATQPWDGGRWHEAVRETEARLRYWELVVCCREAKRDDDMRLYWLWRLEQEIGEERYAKGWRPPEIPPAWKVAKPWPKDEPMRRAQE